MAVRVVGIPEAGVPPPPEALEDQIAHLDRIVDGAQLPDVHRLPDGAPAPTVSLRRSSSAAGGAHDDVGQAEEALERTLADRDVLHVREGERHLANAQDP